jgi:hypothetical protein
MKDKMQMRELEVSFQGPVVKSGIKWDFQEL